MVENRKGCVLGTRRCDPIGYAQVAHCVVAHNGTYGVDQIARSIGMQRAALTRKADGFSYDLSVRQVLAIRELLQDTRMVEEIAREAGGVFVPLDTRAISDQDIRQAFVAAVRELGEDAAAIERALEDGHVSEDDAVHVGREIDQSIAALLAVKARVQSKAQAPTLRRVTA